MVNVLTHSVLGVTLMLIHHAPQLAKYASQLLKKVPQATPKGLLHLLCYRVQTFQPTISLDPYLATNGFFI